MIRDKVKSFQLPGLYRDGLRHTCTLLGRHVSSVSLHSPYYSTLLAIYGRLVAKTKFRVLFCLDSAETLDEMNRIKPLEQIFVYTSGSLAALRSPRFALRPACLKDTHFGSSHLFQGLRVNWSSGMR